MSLQNNNKPLNWVLISAVGFVVFFAIAILFSIYSNRLNLIRSSAYFFLLVPLGLIAAGFLFGALRSHAKYSGKVYGGNLELSGPVVVMVLIILLGLKFRPKEESFSITINLFETGNTNKAIENGELNAYYGVAHIIKKINEGQVVLSEIPQEFLGKEITLIPHAEGYSTKEQKKIIPIASTAMNIYLEKIPDSVTVSGIVTNKKGLAVKNAVLVFANGLIKDSTDKFGNFHITLPFKDGAETTLRVYTSNQLSYDNLVTLSQKASLNIQLR